MLLLTPSTQHLLSTALSSSGDLSVLLELLSFTALCQQCSLSIAHSGACCMCLLLAIKSRLHTPSNCVRCSLDQLRVRREGICHLTLFSGLFCMSSAPHTLLQELGAFCAVAHG